MGRRYLTEPEVESALQRGKGVEALIGRCEESGRIGFRHIALGKRANVITMRVFDTVDVGIANSDVTEWGPLNPALTFGEADQQFSFPSLSDCLIHLESAWPGSSGRFVNEGMLQDEYLDFRKTQQSND